MPKTVIGVDVGGTKISALLVRDNEILKKAQLPTESFKTQEEILTNIFSAIDAVYDPDVEAIGIGLPGTLDLENGTIISCPNVKNINGLNIRQKLEEKYDLDVFIDNDANCFALGEYTVGDYKNYKNMVAIILGTGVGAGVVINGKLVTGINCAAGEFGRLPYKDKNFEYYCAGSALTRLTGIEGSELMQLARQGNKKALAAFEQFGQNLADLLKAVIYTVDPQVVVLGASAIKSYEFFKEPMFEKLAEMTDIARLPVVALASHPDAYCLGAAALCLQNNRAVKAE